MKRLPVLPSKLIRVALLDLKKVETDKNYYINMGYWHEPYDGVCMVCLAGAVMAKTLAFKRTSFACASSFGNGKTSNKLSALNSLRTGDVGEAFEFLGLDSKKGNSFNRQMETYGRNRDGFFKGLEQLAADLEAGGF